MARWAAALVLAALGVLGPGKGAAETRVDLELLLAVDASGSVNQDEFALQLGGIAAAFRDPAIHQAIVSGPEGRIAVALMIWSDAMSRKAVSEWRVLDGPAAALGFAELVIDQIARRGSFLGKTGTGIGSAVGHAVREIRLNGFDGTRKIIDVSGDGPETRLMFGEGMMLPEAHRRAARAGVTINGLAILSDHPQLDIYYQNRVILGAGSFVIPAADFVDFRRAIRLKLLREIQMFVGEGPGAFDVAAAR